MPPRKEGQLPPPSHISELPLPLQRLAVRATGDTFVGLAAEPIKSQLIAHTAVAGVPLLFVLAHLLTHVGSGVFTLVVKACVWTEEGGWGVGETNQCTKPHRFVIGGRQ